MHNAPPLRRIKAFIFDLDGVLVDSYYCWFHLLNDTLQKQGKPPLPIEAFDASWGQGVEADQQMFFPEWTVEEVIRFYNQHFSDYTRWARPEPGASSLLDALKANSKRIVVASNSPNAVVHNLLEVCDLTHYPDFCLGVDEVKEGKPAPDLIFAALDRLRIGIREACYVGDSVFDEQAARSADIVFIGYKREGDYRIERLDELIGQL